MAESTIVTVNNIKYNIMNTILQEIPLLIDYIGTNEINISFDISNDDVSKIFKKLTDCKYNKATTILYEVKTNKDLETLHNTFLFCEYLCIRYIYMLNGIELLITIFEDKEKYVYFNNYDLSLCYRPAKIDFNHPFLRDQYITINILKYISILYNNESFQDLIDYLQNKNGEYVLEFCRSIILSSDIRTATKELINYNNSPYFEEIIVKHVLTNQHNSIDLLPNSNDIKKTDIIGAADIRRQSSWIKKGICYVIYEIYGYKKWREFVKQVFL